MSTIHPLTQTVFISIIVSVRTVEALVSKTIQTRRWSTGTDESERVACLCFRTVGSCFWYYNTIVWYAIQCPRCNRHTHVYSYSMAYFLALTKRQFVLANLPTCTLTFEVEYLGHLLNPHTHTNASTHTFMCTNRLNMEKHFISISVSTIDSALVSSFFISL